MPLGLAIRDDQSGVASSRMCIEPEIRLPASHVSTEQKTVRPGMILIYSSLKNYSQDS